MTLERMIELLLWNQIANNGYSLRGYDTDKINKRYEELVKEFFEPYVIDKNSKE